MMLVRIDSNGQTFYWEAHHKKGFDRDALLDIWKTEWAALMRAREEYYNEYHWRWDSGECRDQMKVFGWKIIPLARADREPDVRVSLPK